MMMMMMMMMMIFYSCLVTLLRNMQCTMKHEKEHRESNYIGQAITPTCFWRCQNIAVCLKFNKNKVEFCSLGFRLNFLLYWLKFFN